MAVCSRCGVLVADGVQFCPSCGTAMVAAPPVAADPAQAYQAPPAQPNQVPPAQPYQAPPAQPYQATPQNDAEANKGMAVIAYIIWFVPLIAGTHKTSPFVKFHTNQGILLFLFAVAWSIVLGIIMGVVTAIAISTYAFGVMAILSSLLSILYLVPVVFVILGIVNAVGGKMNKLPIIGGLFTILK